MTVTNEQGIQTAIVQYLAAHLAREDEKDPDTMPREEWKVYLSIAYDKIVSKMCTEI